MTTTMTLPATERIELLGCRIDALDMDETVERCRAIIESGGSVHQVSVNASKLVALRSDPRLREIVGRSDLVNADGQSVVWAARLLGQPLPGRVAGIDLMLRLLELAEDAGYRVYFLGARREVLEEAVARLRAGYPRLEIAGMRDGYFADAQNEEVCAEIEAAQPDVLFVAMSSPRKEYWLSDNSERIGVPLVMGVGGALDVVAGLARRAPRVLQRLGLEWVVRLLQEPRRLFGRYARTNTRFVWLVAQELVHRGPAAERTTSDKLSILVVTNMYPTPKSPYYGTFVAEQVEALRRDDAVETVDVIFVDGREKRSNYVRGVQAIRRAVKERRYDIVHAHHGLAGAVAVTQRRVPVVVTYHGSDLRFYPWQRWVSRAAARLADVNVCVAALDIPRLHAPAVHLTCAVDTAAFAPPDRESARRRFEISEDALALLFPGSRRHPQKAYDRFEEVRDELRARGHPVHELRLENVDRHAVPELLAAADVLVLTSISEGSPVSVMEALAGGVPIVATDVGDVRAMLEGVPNCYVGPYDGEEFASAVEAVATKEPRVAPTRSRRFDQSRIVAGLLGAYGAARARREGGLSR